jgi:hypothetical protein
MLSHAVVSAEHLLLGLTPVLMVREAVGKQPRCFLRSTRASGFAGTARRWSARTNCSYLDQSWSRV